MAYFRAEQNKQTTGVISPFRHGRLSQTELRRREQVAGQHKRDSLVYVKQTNSISPAEPSLHTCNVHESE